jgi:YHS domain-containing protein
MGRQMRIAMTSRFYRQSGVLKAGIARQSVLARRMTAALALGLGLSFGLALLSAPPHAQGLRINDDIIADPNTGAALLGFDPVAYFIDQRARKGYADLQAVFAGKVWYFASPANKSAFTVNPDPYLPAFGGHDPVGIAAGFAVSGSPEFFALDNNRIYIFRHAQSRAAFLADPAIRAAAERNWPQVRRDLVP